MSEKRFTPAFSGDAERIIKGNKELLEEIHGPLTWDEFVVKQQAYIDITPKERVLWLHKRLNEIAREAQSKGEPSAADLIEYFADLVRSVMIGKVSREDAENAILYAGRKRDA